MVSGFQLHSCCGKILTILHIYKPFEKKMSPCTFFDFAEKLHIYFVLHFLTIFPPFVYFVLHFYLVH